MKLSNRTRTFATIAVLSLVLVAAVRSATAHVSTAREATALVEQRMMQVRITPVVANNDIDLGKANKNIDVAILGETSWNFSDIDPQTVEFAGAIPSKSNARSGDVDNDGVSDRTYSFTTRQLKLLPTDTLACMKLQTVQKLAYVGCDKVKVIPAKGQY